MLRLRSGGFSDTRSAVSTECELHSPSFQGLDTTGIACGSVVVGFSARSAKIRAMATVSELDWALTYDAYERIADDPNALLQVLTPALSEYETTGRVPSWAGVDLLRAWAFYRQREAHHTGFGEVTRDWDDVLDAIRNHPGATASDIPPDRLVTPLEGKWAQRLAPTLDQPFWAQLMDFVTAERRDHDVRPKPDQTFRAFDLTPYEAVRVVILGQDPYPTPGDADGLAFSVSNPESRTPDSLRNIFQELHDDLGVPVPKSNSLQGWADQGVLLLNTALTIRIGSKSDHKVHRHWRWNSQGWTTFTDAVISALAEKEQRVVFILWGNDARRKAKLIDAGHHDIIEEVHPSPLSAYKGFFGSKPFSKTNALLVAQGGDPIDWARNA